MSGGSSVEGGGGRLQSTVGGYRLTNVVVLALCICPLKYLVQLHIITKRVSLKLGIVGKEWG